MVIDLHLLDHGCLADEARLCLLLDDDDRQRWESIRHPLRKKRFLMGRALLRHLIGIRLRVPPKSLRFSYNPWGKPTIDAPLSFTISHSGTMTILAISEESAIGIDLAHYSDARICTDIKEFLTLLLRRPVRDEEILPRWTEVEAAIKAEGQGWKEATAIYDAYQQEGRLLPLALPNALTATLALQEKDPVTLRYWQEDFSVASPILPSGDEDLPPFLSKFWKEAACFSPPVHSL